jgi:hypothetical protein
MQVMDSIDADFGVHTEARAVERREAVAGAEARLQNSAYRGELRNVFCSYRGGILTLHGRVSSYYLKQLAQALVAGLGETGDLNNQVEVVE